MADDGVPTGGRVVALAEAMALLESLPPAGPRVRERGWTSEADLIAGLDDPDADVRRGCLELIADAWTEAAAPRVVARLDDAEWVVRYYAAHALARGTGRDADDVVVPAAIRTASGDPSTYVRMMATEVVGGAVHTDPAAADALATVRDTDAEPAVRRKAARFL